MGMLIESIGRFDTGLVDDIRLPVGSGHAQCKHFDIYSNPLRLTPYRSTEAESDATSAAHLGTYDIRNFKLGTNGKMYALGNDLSGHPQIFEKTDPTTGNWVLSTTAAGNAALIYGAFIEWQGAWWGMQGTNQVWKWVYGTNTFTNTVTGALGTTIVTVAQPVVGADDNMYMFYNNKVVRVSPAGVVTDNVLANLPSDMRITAACRWGTYIMIGMAYGTSATAAPVGVSKVFIWDLVTSTTVYDVIDWGEGALMCLGNIENRIVGVTNKYLETPSGLTSLAVSRGSMVVRVWSGGAVQTVKEVVGNQGVILGRFIRDVVVKDNKMCWVASVPFNQSTGSESTYHLGIWAFGRKNSNSNFALTLEYIEEAVSETSFYINSFGAAGNYWFINHSASSSITRTAGGLTPAGPLSPGTTVDDSSLGTTAWTNPNNSQASDNVYATASLGPFGFTHYLKATNFGFTIPTNATITGIRVELERKGSAGGFVSSIEPVKGGVIGSTGRRDLTTFPTSDAYAFISDLGVSDLWSTTWTASDINSSGFGFAFLCSTIGASTISIDHIRVTVHYSIFNFTSIYESVIFNSVKGLRYRHVPDSSTKKKLIGVTLSFDPLPAGATVVLKYRKDEETSYTQIFSYSSIGAISHSAINIESTGATLPEYKEIQYRIESTGGAIITDFKCTSESEDKDLY